MDNYSDLFVIFALNNKRHGIVADDKTIEIVKIMYHLKR